MSISLQSLQTALAELITGSVAPASDADTVAGRRPQVVVTPATEDEVAAVLAYADREGLRVLARGGGTHLGLGLPPTGGDIVLSMAAMNQVIEHAPHDQTVSVQAGLPLAALQRALGRTRQWLALDPPPSQSATIGGLIATNRSGPRRLRYGGVRDQIIGVRVALADGTIAKGGGKVVKNVAGYDLPKLFTGSLGTLGVIVSATFRLYPLAAVSRTVSMISPDVEALDAIALGVTASQMVPAAIDMVGSTAADTPATLAVRFETGTEPAADEQAAELTALAGTIGSGATVLRGDGEDALWQRFDAALAPSAENGGTSMLVKASVLPTEVARWLSALRREATERGLQAAWRAHAGHGLIWARLQGDTSGLTATVEPLRAAARAGQGSLVVEDAPLSITSAVDVWGKSEGGMQDVLLALKARFDPHGTLNPGRFVGGI